MAAEIDEGICIRHWDWSETSQTVVIFTRRHGVVRALAKGSRRPKSPYSGGLELLTGAECGLILRPQSELALLTYWDLKQTFPAFRTVLAAHNAGMYIADLIMQFVRDHDAHPALFDATVNAMGSMHAAPDVPGAVLIFQWSLLAECGFRPELSIDVRTGEELAPEAECLFHPALGGLVAAATAPRELAAGAWRLRRETLDLLRGLAAEPRSTAGAAPIAMERGNRLLASYARHLLGYQTSTMVVMFGDGLVQ